METGKHNTHMCLAVISFNKCETYIRKCWFNLNVIMDAAYASIIPSTS